MSKEGAVVSTAASTEGRSVGRRRTSQLALLVALAVSGVAISLAATFSRPAPPSAAQPPGMDITDAGVSLTADAPQWQVLKLGQPTPDTDYWSDPVPARVRIDETRSYRVGGPIAGRVGSVLVDLGQRVKIGDPLLSVASSGIAELRAHKEKAAVDLEAAKAELTRIQAMVKARALPTKELLGAEQRFRKAEVAYHLTVAKLDSLKVSTRVGNEFLITAPSDGIVVEKNVLPAQEVSPESGTALIVIADLSSVWVVADLFEADAVDVRQGAPARVTSPSLPTIMIEGTVEMVSSVVDPVRHTIPVRLRVPNPDGQLRPNMYAQVRFTIAAHAGAVKVPLSAMVTDGAHQYVYVHGGAGRFERREVVTGSAHDGSVLVLSGLRGDEQIAQEGAILLDNASALAH
jgi:membrane fusion protein, heavy metal efflux system